MIATLKKILRSKGWAVVNTKHRWGIDLMADLNKIFSNKRLQTVLDIGANEGAFADELLKAIQIKKLYAIEPSISAFTKLKKRFSKNNQVHCDKYAIGESSGTHLLYTYEDSKKNTLYNSLRDQMRKEEGKSEEIEIITLDKYASNYNITEIDFLKIDVEGNEMKVLKGAVNLLTNSNIKSIFCEFHKILAFENNNSEHTNLSSMTEFLDPYGFRFVALYIQGVHLSENLVTCNVLFVRKSLLNVKGN